MPDTIRILMIDDDEEDYLLVKDIIDEIDHFKYSLEWAPSYAKGIKLILEKKHHVYLIDYRIGIQTGDELIKEAIEKGCEEPLILLTGQNDREIDFKALQAGAADYLVKSEIDARTLENAIRYSIAHANHYKEIKRNNAQLEDRVKERTLFLEETIKELEETKQNLNEALEKEKELNELKSRFVSMASHEFRTPLATILTSLELIAKYGERKETDKQLKHIERIKSGVTNLTYIINDVLSLSKLEEGGVTVHAEKFNIDELAITLQKEMQAIAKPGQQILYTHIGKSEVFLDTKILKNIFLNLLSNAIKFSPEGKPISIKTKTNAVHLEITIEDKGIGISEGDQKHLFQRFFRAQNANDIQGTGLGLSILAKYVNMLHGTLDYKSKLGEGTTFILTLPKFFSC